MLVEHTLVDGPTRLGYAEGPVAGPPMVHLHRLIEDRRSFDPLLAERVPPRPVQFGHSYGALVATVVASRLPDALEAFLLIDPPLAPPRSRASLTDAELMAEQAGRTDPERVASVIDMSAMQDHSYPELCAAVACPTLLLQADTAHGGALSDHDTRTTLGVLANGRLVRITGAGHMIQDEAPEVYAREVLEFLKEVR
ncbi:MAG: alpha/beta hydrolase [Trueperaceae bacterium]|nr:MAG: alpha/beta hydrolase [Trueperaceae bacterium]